VSLEFDPRAPVPTGPVLGALSRAMHVVNQILLVPCMVALVAASGILTYSVLARYFLKIPTDWQDEASVFLLVGAIFLSGAYVQSFRGHIGIEALAGVLPAAVNRWRLILVDIATGAFCMFFSWKSWTLLHVAWVDGQTTSSSWGPPLSIPYSLMAVGMTLLSIQVLLQLAARIMARPLAR
jgi:TRAP-type C4-dicarboxylate transport system permease small subunit